MPPKLKSFLKFIGYTSLFVTTCIAFIIGMAFYLFYSYDQEIYYKEKFDEQKWKAGEAFYDDSSGYYLVDYDCTRGKMVKDLERRHLKVGSSKSEITNIIGNARHQRQYNNIIRGQDLCDQYPLGACEYAEKNILVICYDKDLKVQKYFISRRDDKGKIIKMESNNEY